MSDVLHIPSKQSSSHDALAEFKVDVHLGLTQANKQIHSKYFYDESGSDLFNKITRHPDYYLTRCEIEILSNCKTKIAALLDAGPFNLIELGPGEGLKTQILIDQFLQDDLSFTYMPIDISNKYLRALVSEFQHRLPNTPIQAVHSDYFRGLEWISKHDDRQNVVLFLGSSIGNFDPTTTQDFLQHLHASLNDKDYVLLGFDLRKDVDVLLKAYNDSDGITRDFNLNLLRRINRELDANFDLRKFKHYATYNVYSGAMESFLISLENQMVRLNALQRNVVFETSEPIHVEYSYKYLIPQIYELATKNGFQIVQSFTDQDQYFIDTLWQVDKS